MEPAADLTKQKQCIANKAKYHWHKNRQPLGSQGCCHSDQSPNVAYPKHINITEQRLSERTSCYLTMVHPLVSEGEGLHVRNFAANIFNNQPQMAEMGRFSSGGIERGTKLLIVYFQHVTVSVPRI